MSQTIDHPLYSDEALVHKLTKGLMDEGHTIFQLWMFSQDEYTHSVCVLQQIRLPRNARVCSLGCGVGGMEYYWSRESPDLQFDLVNRSQAQLCLCRCPGIRTHAKIENIHAYKIYDCVILAYVLGHVDVEKTLRQAERMCKPGGKILVLDVFDSAPVFDRELLYDSPKTGGMVAAGFECEKQYWVMSPMIFKVGGQALVKLVELSTPNMWIKEVP